ncbi:MAG TPA: hypothetical protein VK501_11580 [Baekduia sp.]|nr:hypothetical protein [Baekduia sp.]HMJ34548.1 hypothetical protein [Baekduia sp.]
MGDAQRLGVIAVGWVLRVGGEQAADVERRARAVGGGQQPGVHRLRLGDERVDVGQLARGELAQRLERRGAGVAALKQQARLVEREARALGDFELFDAADGVGTIAVTEEPDTVLLTIDAPEGAEVVLAELVDAFRGQPQAA